MANAYESGGALGPISEHLRVFSWSMPACMVSYVLHSSHRPPGVGKSLKPEVYPVTAGLEKGFEEFGLATCGSFVID